MPKSRGRRDRRTHDKLRSRRRQAAPRDERREVRAACRAFDEGDVARALRRLRRVPLVGGPGWADEWQELLDAGPDAPGWLWCRAVTG